MFGCQARLLVDIIYGTSTLENEGQGVGQYVLSLKKRRTKAFELVCESTSNHHMHQKILYDMASLTKLETRSGFIHQ